MYLVRPVGADVTWEEAQEALGKAMLANNNRQNTVDDYLYTIKVLRATFPGTCGPAEITTRLAKAFKAKYATEGYVRRKARSRPRPSRPISRRSGDGSGRSGRRRWPTPASHGPSTVASASSG